MHGHTLGFCPKGRTTFNVHVFIVDSGSERDTEDHSYQVQLNTVFQSRKQMQKLYAMELF